MSAVYHFASAAFLGNAVFLPLLLKHLLPKNLLMFKTKLIHVIFIKEHNDAIGRGTRYCLNKVRICGDGVFCIIAHGVRSITMSIDRHVWYRVVAILIPVFPMRNIKGFPAGLWRILLAFLTACLILD